MKQCFAYIRVSTVKQGEGVSLSEQRDAIEAFAKRENIQIKAWFEEKETAAKCGRPVFKKMVQALKRRQADGMIMHKIDRSARNLKDWSIIGDLSDAGIDVYFATEALDFRSRGGRLTADMLAVIAADYIRNLSFESRKGIHGRFKQGIYPFPAPIGYLNAGGGKPKTLDPIRAPLVKELLRLYLTGDFSITTLHKRMADRGLTNRGNRTISRGAVERILKNPFYCGILRNGRTGELFTGIHEPLITVKQYERIADIREGRCVKKQARHDHLLRRLFKCSVCDRMLTPERQKGHVYYRCHSPGCPTKTVREDRLDEAILNALMRCQLSGAAHEKCEEKYRTWRAHHGFRDELNSIDLRIKGTQARLDRLTDLYVDGEIAQIEHDRKRDRLICEITKLREDRKEIEDRSASDRDRRRFFELMKSLAPLYISAEPSEKRVLVQNCFSNRSWNGENVELKPSDLIEEAQTGLCVPYGGPIRATLRTFIGEFHNATPSYHLNDSGHRRAT